MSQGSTESPSIRDKIVRAARACIGTPWRHQGRVPGQHLDCAGLVRYTGIATGLLDRARDVTAYGRMPQPVKMRAILSEFFDFYSGQTPLKPGSIVWLSILGDPMHLAIYTGDDSIVHAVSSGPMKVVEHGFRGPWPKRIHAVLEWKGIADYE